MKNWLKGAYLAVVDFGAGAWAPRGCWSSETRVSTRRADAMGAIPGRVTVHC